MQGYNGSFFLDVFGLTSSSYFMNIPLSSATIPQISSVVYLIGPDRTVLKLTGINLSNMSSLSITINGSTNYILSTKNNDTSYTFPNISLGTYFMQGYNGLVYLDAFATNTPITFTTSIDNTNIPLISNVVI
jgi:hypothetical protein